MARPFELESRQAKAIRLRLAGHSLSQIARSLGLNSNGVLSRWLRDVPPPAWTRRPRAKDAVREEAIRLRLEGRSYSEIQATLGVSKSSLSLWLRDVPLTEEYRERLANKLRVAAQKRAASVRTASQTRARRLVDESAGEIGELSELELFVAGVVAYWAEGTKSKPWGPRAGVAFINSDPGMVKLFLAWLALLKIGLADLSFRIHIHESADIEGALRFWSGVVGCPAQRFQRTTLKRHNPRTVRKNVGADYHGCIIVKVKRSTDLNTRIRGWFDGIVSNLP